MELMYVVNRKIEDLIYVSIVHLALGILIIYLFLF